MTHKDILQTRQKQKQSAQTMSGGSVARKRSAQSMSVYSTHSQQQTQQQQQKLKKLKKNKYIFIFDFDYTLTDNHSGGVPSSSFKMMKDPDKLKTMLDKLRARKIPIYICTRGLQDDIQELLNKQLDGRFKVYGARDEAHIERGTAYWAREKKDILQHIIEKDARTIPEHAYFFDDTEANCAEARKIPRLNVYNNAERFNSKEQNSTPRLVDKILQDQTITNASSGNA